MPVWHAALAPWREEGLVEVVGIAQEQHPDRTRLYAAWQGLDWPILWDPFNLSGSKVVPNHVLVDERGIVRGVGGGAETLEAFLTTEAEPPGAGTGELVDAAHPNRAPRVVGFEGDHGRALSELLWRVPGALDAAVETLEGLAREHPDDGRLAFHAGVARRLRYDSPQPRPDDFQAALDHWRRALALDPSQYVWRRRIQQYGPRLDKPYPFYPWVEEARRALLARGETPPPLAAALTPSERAGRSAWLASEVAAEPDPDGRIPSDPAEFVRIETAAAFASTERTPTASVHLVLRPLEAEWNDEGGPLVVWLEPLEPTGVELERRLLVWRPGSTPPDPRAPRQLDVEVRLPAGAPATRLAAYALYGVCEETDGRCLYLRQAFEIALRP